MLFGEGRVIDGDVGLVAAADQAGPRQGETAAMVQATDTAQQSLLLVAAILVLRRRRLQQALDFALQHHLHAIHVYRIACAQQGHPAHRSTIDVDAADTIADLQPEAAIVHAELGQQQGAVAGIAEPHAAVGLAHDALHPGPQGLVGLLLLTEVNKQVLHAAQPSRLVANEEEPTMSAWRGGPRCAQCSPSLIIPALRQEPACPPSMSATPTPCPTHRRAPRSNRSPPSCPSASA
jgi:hypothetical protein